jgi:hypothetical protein
MLLYLLFSFLFSELTLKRARKKGGPCLERMKPPEMADTAATVTSARQIIYAVCRVYALGLRSPIKSTEPHLRPSRSFSIRPILVRRLKNDNEGQLLQSRIQQAQTPQLPQAQTNYNINHQKCPPPAPKTPPKSPPTSPA